MLVRSSVLITLLLSLCHFAIAQDIIVNQNGDTLLLWSDGTWENLDKKEQKNELRVENIKVNVNVDPLDGKRTISTDSGTDIARNNDYGSMSILSLHASETYFFEITLLSTNLGCLSKYDGKILVKLLDESIIEFSQFSSTDCSDNPTARYIPVSREIIDANNMSLLKGELDKNISQLLTSGIDFIRVHGSEYYSDFNPRVSIKHPNPEQYFIQNIRAIQREL